MRWKFAAAFVLALFVWAGPALAGDTFNLKLTKDNDAVDQQAHWRHRWWHRGYYGFYAPYHRSFNYYPRAYGWAYWYPRTYLSPYAYYSSPAYYYSYATPNSYYAVNLGATATPYVAPNGGAATFRVQPPTEVDLPPPRPYQEDSFPYDSGPSKPPTPREEAAPLKSPPVNSVPLEGRSVSLPAAKAKYTYTAYGEEPTRIKTREDRAVTVKKEQGNK
jgi:hypothetical protein